MARRNNEHFVIHLNHKTQVTCTNGKVELTLDSLPIEVLGCLDVWMKELIKDNGGYGEITFRIKAGKFRLASFTETYHFTDGEKQDETP
jgi:hypothetical protein